MAPLPLFRPIWSPCFWGILDIFPLHISLAASFLWNLLSCYAVHDSTLQVSAQAPPYPSCFLRTTSRGSLIPAFRPPLFTPQWLEAWIPELDCLGSKPPIPCGSLGKLLNFFVCSHCKMGVMTVQTSKGCDREQTTSFYVQR